MNLASLAMKYLGSANHVSAKCFTNRLVTQTYAKNRKLPGEAANQIDTNSGVSRRAGPRRNHDALRFAPCDLFHSDFVIAMHFHVAAQLTKILREVVGKRIVVVEQQNHDFFLNRPARCATSRAVNRARDLL